MPHRFLSGCLLMVVSVSMMPHGEAVSAALFISTMVPHGCINMPYDKAKTLYENIQYRLLCCCLAVSLMCRDRQRTEVHLSGSSSSGHRRMTETTEG